MDQLKVAIVGAGKVAQNSYLPFLCKDHGRSARLLQPDARQSRGGRGAVRRAGLRLARAADGLGAGYRLHPDA